MAHLSTLSKKENKNAVEDILGGIVFTNPFPNPAELPTKLSVSEGINVRWNYLSETLSADAISELKVKALI